MDKSFSLDIEVINGQVQEFPTKMFFRCDLVHPVGETLVRYFDDEMCSVVKKTFYLRVGQDLFGTNQFKTVKEFRQFQSTVCCGEGVIVFIDGCSALIDGEGITY